MFKKFFRYRKLIAFFVFCFLVCAPVALAQYSMQDYTDAISDDSQNLQKYNLNTVSGIAYTLTCGLAGCDAPGLQVGAIGTTSNMIASLYTNPPASGVAYVADVINRISPVQAAYAQTGTGFNGLSPILPIWRAFRNFAYVFFAVIFVAIGLATMFRMKLDPRTVLTVQSAIPRMVVGLLLVTFSYAIAGLMVDLLYLMIALVVLMFSPVLGSAGTAEFQTKFLTGGFGTTISGIMGIVGAGGAGFMAGIGALAGAVGFGIFSLTSAGVGLSMLFGPGEIALIGAGLGVVIIMLILLVIITFLLFKLFLELLKAYIGIIIGVVLAPLIIALGVIPGLPGFSSWIKNLAVNIIIFPAVAFVIILGQVLTKNFTNNLWHPPLLAGGSILATFIPILIGFGFLLMIHQVPQFVRNMFGIKPLGFAFGEALMVPVAAGQAAYGNYQGKKKGRMEAKRHVETVDALGRIESRI